MIFIKCALQGTVRVSRTAVFAAIVSLLPGCSFLFTQSVPDNYEDGPNVPCSTNQAPPVLDTIFTLTNAVSLIYVAAQENVPDKGGRMLLGLSTAAMWALSANYGYTHTHRCEVVQRNHDDSHYQPRMILRRSPPAPVPAPLGPAGRGVTSLPDAPAGAPSQTPAAHPEFGPQVAPAPPTGLPTSPGVAPTTPPAPVAPAPPAAPPVPQELDSDEPARRPAVRH